MPVLPSLRSPLALVHLFQLFDQVGNIAVDRIRHDAPLVAVHLGKQLPHDRDALEDAERFDHAVTQRGIVALEFSSGVPDSGFRKVLLYGAHGFSSTLSEITSGSPPSSCRTEMRPDAVTPTRGDRALAATLLPYLVITNVIPSADRNTRFASNCVPLAMFGPILLPFLFPV